MTKRTNPYSFAHPRCVEGRLENNFYISTAVLETMAWLLHENRLETVPDNLSGLAYILECVQHNIQTVCDEFGDIRHSVNHNLEEEAEPQALLMEETIQAFKEVIQKNKRDDDIVPGDDSPQGNNQVRDYENPQMAKDLRNDFIIGQWIKGTDMEVIAQALQLRRATVERIIAQSDNKKMKDNQFQNHMEREKMQSTG